MARRRISFNRDYNINSVVTKIVTTVLALWVGGVVLEAVRSTLLTSGDSSQFFDGLTLIGWNVSNGTVVAGTTNGILTVVGLIGIGSVIMEFVKIKMG